MTTPHECIAIGGPHDGIRFSFDGDKLGFVTGDPRPGNITRTIRVTYIATGVVDTETGRRVFVPEPSQ